MPNLTILVDQPAEGCTGQRDVQLTFDDGGADIPGVRMPDGALRYIVKFDLVQDKEGNPRPAGKAIKRQGDGRRFVYLNWIGTPTNGPRTMFRRLKVFFDQVPGFPGDAENYSVRVQGTDKKGEPACATSVPIGAN